jgi:hypothetical protein
LPALSSNFHQVWNASVAPAGFTRALITCETCSAGVHTQSFWVHLEVTDLIDTVSLSLIIEGPDGESIDDLVVCWIYKAVHNNSETIC